MVHLLIDGYNLLHVVESDLTRSRAEAPLEVRRKELLELLRRYQAEKNVNLTAVFDSSEPSGIWSPRDRVGGVQVVYTSATQTADEWIDEACAKHPRGYVVVSNDLEVKASAENYGCLSLSATDFSARLRQVRHKIEIEENPYLEDKDDDEDTPLYRKVSTKKKGVPRRLPKRERRKIHQLKNL